MQSSVLVNLGNNLTTIRESTKLNAVEFFQKYLAGTERGRTLTSEQAIRNLMSKIENGKMQISFEMLLKYSEIGNVSVDSLLKDEEYTPQIKTNEPETLADILSMIFDLQEWSDLSNVGVNDSTAGIYLSIQQNDIYSLNYCMVLDPPDDLTEPEAECIYNSAHAKAVLYGFISRWAKMLQSIKNIEKDDPDMAQESYLAWKEKMLKLAEQYDVHGNPLSQYKRITSLPVIAVLEERLDRIFDPYGLCPDGKRTSCPSTAKDLFS